MTPHAITHLEHDTSDELTEPGSNALLYALGAAMIFVTILACALIVEGSMLWLMVAFGGLVVTLGVVAAFIMRFIDADH